MSRSARLLRLLRPYTSLFVANLFATLGASVLDGATFVLLIPFLRAFDCTLLSFVTHVTEQGQVGP